ncbi:MAG: hypothetical protein WDM85_14365 [Caulobacteraceae bacterium]
MIKSPKGWGVGLHTYGVEAHRPWMDQKPAFSLSASHQDQVVEPTPAATVSLAATSARSARGLRRRHGDLLPAAPRVRGRYSIALIEGRRGQRYPGRPGGAGDREPEGPRRPRPLRRLDRAVSRGALRPLPQCSVMAGRKLFSPGT